MRSRFQRSASRATTAEVSMDNSTFFKTLGTIIGLYAVVVMLMAGMIIAIVAAFHG
ncbi:hypothetical protein [Pectobacterium carotovorum]|uniref:hypothetical protein n=1 Tax=Pectobacterium carotovorum TaxID=554 RepID=UPI001F1F42BE|nr:hypothetical protein [Pectobacterium carotovorum]